MAELLNWLVWLWHAGWPYLAIVIQVFIVMWIADYLIYVWEVRKRKKYFGEGSYNLAPPPSAKSPRWKFSFWPRFLRRRRQDGTIGR